MKLDAHKTGLALGAVFAVWHGAWSLLVAIGLAKALLDFSLSLHFLANPFVIQGFSFVKALTLMVFTGVVGYALGWVFAMIWNKLHKA